MQIVHITVTVACREKTVL